ncbi:AsmA family protein [Pusillimonas sp. TS35]|nr:AsmA family protein [Pusillimonas sp. TS35]
MKVWFKRVLFSLVVVAIVALVGVAIFLLTFDPNAYKTKIEEIVYNRYQRTLAIKGDIQLSLFPRIGLAVQDVSLSNRNSPDTFASIDSARFAVAIWPLLFNRFVVDHVAVTGFKAWIKRDEAGQFNFSDLLRASASRLGGMAPALALPALASSALQAAQQNGPPAESASAPDHSLLALSPLATAVAQEAVESTDFDIDIAGLDLKGGEIHLHDSKTGAVARIEKLDIDTGRVTFNQAFDVTFKGRLMGEYPAADASLAGQGLLRLNPHDRIYSAQKFSLQASGVLGPLKAKTATVRGNFAYNALSELLDVSNIEVLVQGEASGEQALTGLETTLSVPRLRMDRGRAELSVEKLAYRAKGKRGVEDFDIAIDAPRLAISPESAKGEPVHATAKFTQPARVLAVALNMNGLGGNASRLSLKELKIEAGLKQGERLIQLNMSSPATWDVFRQLGGLSAMKGDIRIDDAQLPGGSFEFPFIGSLQADLLKDKVETGIDAVLSGSKLNFRLTGTELADPKLAFAFKADKLDFNTLFPSPPPAAPAAGSASGKPAEPAKPAPKAAPKPASKAPAPAPAASDMPDLSFLAPLDLTGTIDIGELKFKELEASAVKAGVRVLAGKLVVDNINAALYDGTLKGSLHAAADNSLGANLTLANVAVGPLLHDYAREDRLTGTGTVSIDLASAGKTAAAVEAGMSGSVKLKLRDGEVRGIDFHQTLGEVNDVVRNVFSGQLPAIMSQVDAARSTAYSSLDAEVSFTQGQGTFTKLELLAPRLRVNAGKPASVDLVNDQLDLVVLVRLVGTGGAADDALKDLRGIVVPLRLSGPFGKLSYQVQWKDINSKPVKQAVREGLVDLLSAQPEPQPGNAATAPKPANSVKSIGDAIKGLLGQ